MTTLSPDLELLGQTVVVIGGSSGIGLATARLARARGADVVLTARDDGKLQSVAEEVGAREFAAFDIADMDFALARQQVGDRLLTPLAVARAAAPKMPARGSVACMGGTGGRSAGIGKTLISALSVGLQSLVASMAVELAPVRVNVIAAGFVDTPLSATLLGDDLDARREELRQSLRSHE